VRYPAPTRHDDGTSVSLVYSDEVVFPLLVTPRDASLPVRLRVEASFGVCREVCIPTQASADVALSDAPDPLSDAQLASYAARVPGAPEPGRFDIEAVTAGPDGLLIDVRMPESSYSDLFADGPAGSYVAQPTFVARRGEISRYRLPLALPLKGQTLRFVAVSGGEAIEKSVVID
jgi:DsbC/DsbD-like thiol-disulfide interchange protein